MALHQSAPTAQPSPAQPSPARPGLAGRTHLKQPRAGADVGLADLVGARDDGGARRARDAVVVRLAQAPDRRDACARQGGRVGVLVLGRLACLGVWGWWGGSGG
jgi:hypothetical protein